MQQLHDIELHKLGFLIVFKRAAADEHVQVLARKSLCQGFCVLLLRKMRQKVGHAKARLIFLFTEAYRDFLPVFQHDRTVQGKRNRRPLVFFDAAVIMGFEQGHLKILIEWVGLEIKAGRINMRRGNPHAFSHALFPDDGENNGFFPV